MPGRSPSEAIDVFMAPLQEALACLGAGHLTLNPGARGRVGKTSSWTLNGGDPMNVGPRAALRAKMHFVVQRNTTAAAAERFRVHTTGYLYSIALGGDDVIRAHYHPFGNSDVKYPHWHVPAAAMHDGGVFVANAHIPSPRVSFEYMVRWLLAGGEASPTRDDWEDRLQRTEALFEQHQTWNYPGP